MTQKTHADIRHFKSIHFFIALGLFLCASRGLAQAQTDQDSSAAPDIIQSAATSQGLSTVPYDQVPRYSTFWLFYSGGPSGVTAVPLPVPPLDESCPIFQMADGEYIVDGTYGGVVPPRIGNTANRESMADTLTLASNAVVDLIVQIQAATAPRRMTMTLSMNSADSAPLPGGSDGSGTNDYTPAGGPAPMPDPGTNLWIAQTVVASGYLNAIGSNTMADIFYEIQSRTNLAQTDWQSEGFITGSEITNWTPLSIFQNGRTNLFIRLRSWVDSFGIGIPDWWQFEYFGTNGVDPSASAAGDGYSNLQKFQMGLNPTNYYNPNGPPGFFGYVDGTGTNVFIAWSAAPGPVINYSAQRGVSNALSGAYTFTQISTVSSNASFIEDVGAINNSNAWNNMYQLEAVYPGNSLSATDTWQVNWYGQFGATGTPYGPPPVTNFYAYADTNATSVLLSWSRPSSVATNYVIERGWWNNDSNDFVYYPFATVSVATNAYKVTGAFTNISNWSDNFAIAAVYPGGVQSSLATSPINVGNTNGLSAPAAFYGYADGTQTNLVLAWTPAGGTPSNYVIFAGNTNGYGTNAYIKIAAVNGSTTNLLVTNGISNLYAAYAIFGVYTNGGISQAAIWQSALGTPAPGNFVAYLDATGTNVWLSWTAPTGAITGYLITRFDPLGDIFQYNLNLSTTSFEDTNAVNTGSFDAANTEYMVQALYPRGGASSTAIAMVGSVPSPTSLAAALDVSGKNVVVTWGTVPGAVNYIIQRGVMNPATGTFTYSTIGTVGPGVTTFTDSGAILTANSYNNRYQVKAIFPGGAASAFSNAGVSESSDVPLSNVYITANSIRNGTGRWQVMFSGLPTNSPQTVQLTWWSDYGGYPLTFAETNLSTTNIIGGIFQVPDALALDLQSYGNVLSVSAQLFGPNGEPGQIADAGLFPYDAPYFVDGRRHMKQNLNFLLRAAPVDQLYFSVTNAAGYNDGGAFNVSGTNFEEFSFLHHLAWGGYIDVNGLRFEDLYYFLVDDLWPFKANYELANFLAVNQGTSYPYGSTNFNFQPNFATNVPAPAILAISDPYEILQPGLSNWLDLSFSSPASSWDLTINPQSRNVSLSSGNNLFGLPFNSGYVISSGVSDYSYQTLSPGGNVTWPTGKLFFGYASWCSAPSLSLVNYYFAPLLPPENGFVDVSGLSLPGEIDPAGGSNVQPFPVPIEDDFNVTNQTPPIIASIGQPMIIGGWAKYSVGSSGKFAYLGQYFQTNVFLFNTNGVVSTNSAGIMSPYGEFFPTQTGVARFMTMPDIDNPSQYATGVVSIISMNVDANHDGIMDLSYGGPDQTSPSRPFRFWANDNIDAGDFGGNFGVPGQAFPLADGSTAYPGLVPARTPTGLSSGWFGRIHGRRDLVDYFPVYLNISSLFQSNALSAGISPTDTNYQFVLSHADGALRFVYTDLTPTNYMNYLLDTNESGRLVGEVAWPISAQGVPLNGVFNNTFLGRLVTNNQAIILVEAATNTTKPLVLTIYHGTNQIAQTSLPLSITGVEQMFRSKTIYLNQPYGAVPDRLTDASVPNEPDTIDKNFVFMHGYNVNPNEARGVASDMYKRMYWSGSHAKFWAVTWEGADSKVGSIFTPNYHTNVVNAFNIAPLLANFITSLTNSGPVVAAAHSLGNMLTLSAISDWHAPISQYFMMDAAVPIEAIDPTATTNMMIYSTWTAYSNRVFASDWYQLFPTNDARSTLAWNDRLSNLGTVDIYNLFSSGEEVLRTTTSDTPPDILGLPVGPITVQLLGNVFYGTPFGTYSWYWQEKGKGTASQDFFLCSSHGGWRFPVNSYGDPNPVPPGTANSLSNAVLQVTPIFTFGSYFDGVTGPFPDLTLTNSSTGGVYAAAYRNRILANAIPAMSLVAGANPIPFFARDHNIDMMTLKNNWSQGRTGNEAGMWHHSDFVQMAYTFTHRLFDTFVTTGNLK